MTAKTLIIGVDCAVQAERVGIAMGEYGELGTRLVVAEGCERAMTVAAHVARWLSSPNRVLLALDAPLGWPRPLARTLASHAAGEAVQPAANAMFRRETDRHVRRTYQKQSLDIGADRIARTAHAALALLEELRTMTGERIPLAWQPCFVERIAAIEVYPAATLTAYGWEHKGYRPDEGAPVRRLLVDRLSERVNVGQASEAMIGSTDVCDAAFCVLAGADFLSGHALPPDDKDLARAEGWIWVRQPRSRFGTT